MAQKTKSTKPRISRKADPEDKKNYSKMVDKRRIHIRMNANERTILECDMRKVGFVNVSGYIKYKTLGLDPERKIDEIIKQKSPEELTILLRNAILDLAECFIYVRTRYEKDMNQLWKEEGVNLTKWIAATNHWQSETSKRMEELLNTVRTIAAKLGLNEYFELPSAKMNIDWENASTEQLDALAAQLRKERIAMGHIEEL